MPDDYPTMRVRLTPLNHDDQIGPREFELRVGEKLDIGRASTNVSKPEFSARRENAYIDSPIISRHHASFRGTSENGVLVVQLEDNASMHGTLVNSRPLISRTPLNLSNNDVLQFGTDISRVNETFVARKYRFSMTMPALARLSPPLASAPMSLSHSRGFQVPEEDSDSDEYDAEDLDDLQLDEELEDELEDAVETGHTEVVDILLIEEDGPADNQDMEFQSSGIPGSEQSPLVLDDDSSMSEDSDISEDEDDEDQVSEAELSSMIDEDKGVASAHFDISEQSQADIDDEESLGANAATLESPLFSSSPASVRPPDVFDKQSINNPQLPTPTFAGGYAFDMHNPPIAPNVPVQETPAWVNASYLYDSGRPYQPVWHGGELGGPPNYMGSNFGDRPSLFSQAPQGAVPQTISQPDITLENGPSSDSLLFSERSNDGYHPVETSSPATRRTKVTIDEIVEGQPQPQGVGSASDQPLPTQTTSNKRKADAIEDEQMTRAIYEAVADEVPHTENAAAVNSDPEPVMADAAATAIATAQRPIRQPSSILKKMSKHVLQAAAYTVAGGVGAVAILSHLPDGFFQV